MNKKIFKSILFAAVAVMLLCMSTLILIMHNTIVHNEQKRIEGFTSFLSHVVNADGEGVLDSFSGKEYRITLIDDKGVVIYDNRRDPSKLGNHSSRYEFIHAKEGEIVSSSRLSPSFDVKTYYFATRLKNGHVLRVAENLDTLLSVSYDLFVYFIVIIVALSIICAIVARHVSNLIVKPLNDININDPLATDIYDEIKPFVTRIVKQQEQIDGVIKELERRNNEFLIITKSMSEGLILLNKDGIIISMNKMAQKIFNVSDECIGTSFLSVDKDNYARNVFVSGKKISRRSTEFSKFDHDYQIHFNQIVIDGSLKGYAMLIIDVTDKNRAQRQRQEFTANVSHELKTPLQSIIGYAELIENGIVKDSDIKTFAGKIRTQSSHLVTLIEDIIFLSRLDEGLMVSIFENISMYKICHEIFDALSLKAQKRNIKLELEGNDIIFSAVYRYIHEAIYNLCDNAIKYNKDGGYVKVILKEQEKKIIITVKDSGLGIPPEHQERIFERFYRVDKSHSRQTGGTGLGLSIVKRVVLFHKGKIKLKSSDKGCEFIITLNRSRIMDMVRKSKAQQELEKATLENKAL